MTSLVTGRRRERGGLARGSLPPCPSSRPRCGPGAPVLQTCAGPPFRCGSHLALGGLDPATPPLCWVVFVGLWVMSGNRENSRLPRGAPGWGRGHTGFQWASDVCSWAPSVRGVPHVGPCLCVASAHDPPQDTPAASTAHPQGLAARAPLAVAPLAALRAPASRLCVSGCGNTARPCLAPCRRRRSGDRPGDSVYLPL